MNIVQITPGAGPMFCGNCLRDNALVTALRRLGHQVTMVPLYLPITLDEPDQSNGTPLFFSGINVYLEQKSSLFRLAPEWLRGLLASPRLLKWAAGKAAGTRAEDLGELTLSMLRGEAGNQALELDQLIAWLKTQPKPDVVCLSNVMLVGMVRRLKSDLDVRVVCTLQGEDTFLDALREPHRTACWRTLAERAADVDRFIAPSRYFGSLMGERLGLPPEKVRVVWNGISLEGYNSEAQTNPAAPQALPHPSTPDSRPSSPVLGFFARMCREKGLDTLVESYLILKQRPWAKHLRLKIGGSCGPADEPFVNLLRQRANRSGHLDSLEFHPNLNRAAKLEFLRSLSVFSVPALYGEGFGLYLIEALAAGVPVVQPRHAAFPEIIEATGGGLLCKPGDPSALAEALETLLLNPARAHEMASKGRCAVFKDFSAEKMAVNTLNELALVNHKS